MAWNDIRRYGAGVGIEIRGDDLRVIALKSRPGKLSATLAETVRGFRTRPAAEWGADYAATLKKVGMAHVSAMVCLPRRDVILRQIQLPPMAEKERKKALEYQLDGLHPFGDEPVRFDAAPLGSGQYLVAIALAETVDAYADRFGEAGVATAGFTAGPLALYGALRMRSEGPPKPLLIGELRENRLEVYGESAARPLMAVEMNLRTGSIDRALDRSIADLRLGEDAHLTLALAGDPPLDDAGAPVSLQALVDRPLSSAEELLPTPLNEGAEFSWGHDLIPAATAVEAACPRLGLRLNLLPEERRQSDSRWRWAPTAALAAMLGLIGVGFAVRPLVQDSAYAAEIESRTDRLEQSLTEIQATRTQTFETRRKLMTLTSLGNRTAQDLRILSELSSGIPHQAWSTNVDIDDDGVEIAGEAASAAQLLSAVNELPNLRNAEFSTSLRRVNGGEAFQIRAQRANTRPPEPTEAPTEATPEQPAEQQPAAEGTLGTLGDEAADDATAADAPAAETPSADAPASAPTEEAQDGGTR